MRVLKPHGSFVMNIKEGVENGERQTYVMELVLALRWQQGWKLVEEYIWHKKNSPPGKWPNRFRDNWEHLFHFTKNKLFNMYQEAVMIPIGDWAKSRLSKLNETDQTRDPSATGSGFGKKVANWLGRDKVYPNNVLHTASECGNKNHSAAFPEDVPEWFIKLFTVPGDTVLDPFAGSGTTCLAAYTLGRQFVGIDNRPENISRAEARLAGATCRQK